LRPSLLLRAGEKEREKEEEKEKKRKKKERAGRAQVEERRFTRQWTTRIEAKEREREQKSRERKRVKQRLWISREISERFVLIFFKNLKKSKRNSQ
jgi:hypothetical protein